MRQDVANDMSWSSLVFNGCVWPLISERVGGGSLMQMEGRPDQELAKLLDSRAGIDAWQLLPDGQMRGIAARVQLTPRHKPDVSYSSFTVRLARDTGAKTEFEKRYEAIHSGRGLIYPHLTVQAYVKERCGPVVNVGICRTIDLIAYIQDGFHQPRRTDNATFAVCFWERMIMYGKRVEVVCPVLHEALQQ